MRANGARWKSRSHLEELDAANHRFSYVSRTDDDNPSRALWSWQLKPEETGTDVTVRWELRPLTFFRERLAAPLRHRQLKNETSSRQLYINDPGVVSNSPVSSQVFRPERIIGQPP